MLYEFNVTGFDCHLPIPYSSTVPVTVYVKAICVSQWNGIPKEIEYSALSNPYPFASNAKFLICPQKNNNFTYLIHPDNDDTFNDNSNDLNEVITEYDYCPIEQVTLRMKILWSKEDIIINDDQTIQPSSSLSATTTTTTIESSSSECDLDYYSLMANRKICIDSSQSKTVDLLPDIDEQQKFNQNNHINLPIIETIEGLNELPKINKKGYPSGIYYFNGSMHFDLNKFNKFHKLQRFDNQLFTINFWMKHSPIFNKQYHEKNLLNNRENILCSSDEYEKNRHHFAVFLHNCKLVVLIRREPTNESTLYSDSSQLLPSQWRFDVDEVCDSNWHHYSLTYRPPETTLVNGQKTLVSKSESDIEGILLLISSSVLAILLILFVAIKRIHRVHLKSNHFESHVQNFQMTSFDINSLKQMNKFQDGRKLETSAEKLRNSKLNDYNSQTIINDHHHQHQQQQYENEQKVQPIRITPNPFVNQSNMKEYEAKTILLDEKRYDASLNMSSSIYNNLNSGSPIVCNPTIQLYENPLRSDEEDDDDFQCSCSENNTDDHVNLNN